ncbi:malonyl-ACP decarboxylase [Gammaproteobacteria bacterium]
MVYVTGLGVVSSIGNGVIEYTQSLKKGISGIKSAHRIARYSKIPCVAEIPDFSFQDLLKSYSHHSEITKRALVAGQRASLAMQASILSVLEAWDSACFTTTFSIPTERIGLIVAGHNLTNNLAFDCHNRHRNAPEYINPRYAMQFMDSDYLGTISEIFDIHGQGFTVGGASASGNVALVKGYESIKAGYLDTCILVAPPANLGPLELQAFYNLGAMGGKRFKSSPEKACRPFDQAHEGFIYGEGCGCLILESEVVTKLRGIHPQAVMLGGAIYLDGNRLSDPSENGEIKAMQLALKDAKKKSEDIEYINAHGTSSPLGDETEIKAIKAVYGNGAKNIWINATKGLIGHCLYSAGVMEAITTIVQMREGFLHPNKNLDNPIDSECKFCGKKEEKVSISTAMNNSFGFGGISTSIILKI